MLPLTYTAASALERRSLIVSLVDLHGTLGTYGVLDSVLQAIRLLSGSLTPPGLSLISELVWDIDGLDAAGLRRVNHSHLHFYFLQLT